MFAKRESVKDKDQAILKSLSDAYKNYDSADWIYGSADIQEGTFLVDECIGNSALLNGVAKIIGKGLIEGNTDAVNACRLFQKLYTEGFAGGVFKQEIQNRFKEILPERSIERLDNGASMADCMTSMFNCEQVFSMMP